jgi:hypothetical protein
MTETIKAETITNAEYALRWRETNKELVGVYQTKYYDEHRERILARLTEVVVCECGCSVQKVNMPKHKKTKKHQVVMEILQNFRRE